MKDFNIELNCKVIPTARERIYQGNGQTAVLLIHGFTGTPNGMDYLARRIHQETNYTVYLPRLPGHGTITSDFRQSNARDWLRKTYDSYINLKNEYKTVYVGGLSMGGLLALLTASHFQVEKLFLIAAALSAHNKLLPFTHIFKHIVPVMENKLAEDPEQYDTEDELKIYHNYWKNHYAVQVAELHKLMRLTKKKLKTIKSDTLILSSKTDEQVPMKAAYMIQKKLSSQYKKMIVFDNSPHVINNGPEKESCAKHIIEFLKD